MTAALCALEAARIDAADVTRIDGVTLESTGERLALVGEWQSLFSLLAGQAELTRGKATLHGCDAATAVAAGVVGLSLCDAPMTSDGTAAQWVAMGARLCGLGSRDADRAAREALSTLGLAMLGARRLSSLGVVERRAVCIAQATLGNPPVLALEEPLTGLDVAAQQYLAVVVDRAATGRRLLISMPRVPAAGHERAEAARAGELWLLDARGSVVSIGAADIDAAAHVYSIFAARNGAALAARLAESGIACSPAAAPPNEAGAARFLARLPEGVDTGTVLDASLAVDAPIVELVPFGRFDSRA